MQGEIVFKGIWFLPEKPDNQVSGELKFSAWEGGHLSLFGWLIDEYDDEPSNPRFILGVTNDGKSITCYRTYFSGRTQSFSEVGTRSSKYNVPLFFEGCHCTEDADLVFSDIHFEFDCIGTWLGIYGFSKISRTLGDTPTNVELSYTQPNNIQFLLGNGLKADFIFFTQSPMFRGITDATVSQKCVFQLSAENRQSSFKELFSWMESFSRFLTLSYFERPEISTPSLTFIVKDSKGEDQERYAKVYFHNSPIKAKPHTKDHHNQFLFVFKDIQDDFALILGKWYQFEEDLGPVLSGFTEDFSTIPKAIELRFLNLAHALETLHRRTRNNDVLPSKEFKKKRDKIIASVDEEYRDWLKEKLNFANERSLHERISDFASEMPEGIRKMLFKPDTEIFIKSFKDTRNYYTHYNESLKKKALTGNELFIMCGRLRIILIYFLLKQLEFSEEKIERIIVEKSQFLFNRIIPINESESYQLSLRSKKTLAAEHEK